MDCESHSYLKSLCVTVLELMPVHDYPGRWNWGYDPAPSDERTEEARHTSTCSRRPVGDLIHV